MRLPREFAVDLLTLRRIPAGVRLLVFAAAGVAVGMAVLVAHVSRATSYLSDVPETCLNCHVMEDAYASWRRSSHGPVTTCTDCHLPHQNPVARLAHKARGGLWHSYVFTFRLEPQVLRLAHYSHSVVQENCLRCHHDQIQMVRLAGVTERRCWDCHAVPHGPVSSLSSSPDALRPPLPQAGLGPLIRPREVPHEKE